MSQNVDNIKPSYPLFREDDYKETLRNKRESFEEVYPQTKIDETFCGPQQQSIKNSTSSAKP